MTRKQNAVAGRSLLRAREHAEREYRNTRSATRTARSKRDGSEQLGVHVTDQRTLTAKYNNIPGNTHKESEEDEGDGHVLGGSKRGPVVINGVDTVAGVWKQLLSHERVQHQFLKTIHNSHKRLRDEIAQEIEAGDGVRDVVVECDETGSEVVFEREFVSETEVADEHKAWLRDEFGIQNRAGKAEYLDLLVNTARSYKTPGMQSRQSFFVGELLRFVRHAGTGTSTTHDVYALADLLTYNTDTGTDGEAGVVTVEFDHVEFNEEFTREQQERTLELLNVLGTAFSVRVVVAHNARVTTAWLQSRHREVLSRLWTPGRRTEVDEVVDEAMVELDAGTTPVDVVRKLGDAADVTLSYHELYGHVQRAKSSVRKAVSKLHELGVVDVYGAKNTRKATLLPSGEALLDELDRVFGEQVTLETGTTASTQRIDDAATASENNDISDIDHGTNNDTAGEGDVTGEEMEQFVPNDMDIDEVESEQLLYQTRWMSRSTQDAVMACAAVGEDVCTVASPVDDMSSCDRFVSVDDEAGEVIVSTHATNPLDYVVGSSIALSSAVFIDNVLGASGIDNVLDDVPGPILRNARHIGYLTDEVLDDGEEFRDMLVSWGEDIAELTRRLQNNEYGEYDSRRAFVGRILRDAHGLAGSVVHLLDAAEVELVRDVRVPVGVNSEKLTELSESMTHAMLIQSTYGSFTVYRQLFEERAEKRAASFSVDVDAADPYASLVGSMVIRGGSAARLRDMLVARLERQDAVHEDAPEFQLRVGIREAGREEVAVTVSRVLARKGLRVTRGAVSVLDAVLRSAFEVAEALEWLASEDSGRLIRADEVRFVLSQMPVEELLPGCARSVGELFSELLRESWIGQSELCELAGVTAQTARNHREWLEASGLVRSRSLGPGRGVKWRVALSFREDVCSSESSDRGVVGEENHEHDHVDEGGCERGFDVYPVPVQTQSADVGASVGVAGADAVFEALRRNGVSTVSEEYEARVSDSVNGDSGGSNGVQVCVGPSIEQVPVSRVEKHHENETGSESETEHEHVYENYEDTGEDVIVTPEDFKGISIPGSIMS